MIKKQLLIFVAVTVLAMAVFASYFLSRPAENGRVVTVKAGRNFTIRLESNPTTGYQWQLADELDKGFVELVDSIFIPGRTDMVGSPGKEEWVFKSVRAGKGGISFKYVRPWEKDEVPAQTYRVTVIAK